MTAMPDCDIVSDAALATAAAAGDRCAFARIYDRYGDRLYNYCLGLVRDHHAAADCVQDLFCEAARHLHEQTASWYPIRLVETPTGGGDGATNRVSIGMK